MVRDDTVSARSLRKNSAGLLSIMAATGCLKRCLVQNGAQSTVSELKRIAQKLQNVRTEVSELKIESACANF